MSRSLAILVAVWVAAATGCSSSPPAPLADAGLDGGADAGRDAGTDAGVDAGTDAGTDGGTDAGIDAGTDAGTGFGLTAITPSNASRRVNTAVTISGAGITGTPTIELVSCDASGVTEVLTPSASNATSISTTLPADPNRALGAYSVNVTNGDGSSASLSCALQVNDDSPPTFTNLTPATAWQGDPADAVDSDATVSLAGTGFRSTPTVRFVSTSDSTVVYDALFVGFVSDTLLNVRVPTETLSMAAGTYDVFVTNPDGLSAQWLNGATAGVFTVTATPPPAITSVNPARVLNGSCTSTELTVTGSHIAAASTLWYVVPSGTVCTGGSTDAQGRALCPLTVDSVDASGTSLTAHFATCPALGPYPLEAVGPDGQSGEFFDLEITPSSDGHLSTGAFTTASSTLETPRWKHAAQFGFDVFGDTLMYVAGGQDGAGNVLGSVEMSSFDAFGTPGPFRHLEQYGGASTPRISNDLNVPRIGLTLLRVGDALFAMGGSTMRTDTSQPQAASTAVERAVILGYDQMPLLQQPQQVSQTGLPTGSWYYRVSAVGLWGESLASRETVAIQQGGSIKVCWDAPFSPGATGYNVYRSLASDGRAGTELAIAYEQPSTCFVDDGADTRTPAPGNVSAALVAGGTLPAADYAYRVSATVPLQAGGTFETYAGYPVSATVSASDVSAGNQSVSLSWDPVGGAGTTYRVYRLDPGSGTYKLLTGASSLTATTFTDDNAAFDASGAVPRTEIAPLPAGSLSTWDNANPPQLGTAREGLDGVVVSMDPLTSNHLVARLLVVGGRDGSSGAYVYQSSAESLGVYDDGRMDAAWSNETPALTHARAYHALVTTEGSQDTPYPPPPFAPPCSGCTPGEIAPTSPGTAPVYVAAVMGDDAFSAASNTGRNDYEACPIDASTGHLVADCGVSGASTWVVQTNTAQHGSYGMDAILEFSYLDPFLGVQTETVASSPSFGTNLIPSSSSIARNPVLDLTTVTNGQIFDATQSCSTSFVEPRGYYQLQRLLGHVYALGGYTASGPTGSIETHPQ